MGSIMPSPPKSPKVCLEVGQSILSKPLEEIPLSPPLLVINLGAYRNRTWPLKIMSHVTRSCEVG